MGWLLMLAWPTPELPGLQSRAPTVSIFDTQRDALIRMDTDGPVRLYVCGITPYDSTHLGHAATYVAFDLFHRACRNAGREVVYVQNVTDVDDPLLERARHLGLPWDVVADNEVARFREDMTALRVLPPTHFVGVAESVTLIVGRIEQLQAAGFVYEVEKDLYFKVFADPRFGHVSGLDREAMTVAFTERGGDPSRFGKSDPLDCLVWRGASEGDPSWPSPWGPGRPGWHIGCATIATEYLGPCLDVQGGGLDLVFPHHEMTAGIGHAIHDGAQFARSFTHTGMVRYNGEKMSKSRGNLVFVSALLDGGIDPAAVRLALLRHHYRESWEFTEIDLRGAQDTVEQWRRALTVRAGAPAAPVAEGVLAALADDLDAPSALAVVQSWVDTTLGHGIRAGQHDPSAAAAVRRLLDAALGLNL